MELVVVRLLYSLADNRKHCELRYKFFTNRIVPPLILKCSNLIVPDGCVLL